MKICKYTGDCIRKKWILPKGQYSTPSRLQASLFSLRFGHARGKTIINRFHTPSRRFATRLRREQEQKVEPLLIHHAKGVYIINFKEIVYHQHKVLYIIIAEDNTACG